MLIRTLPAPALAALIVATAGLAGCSSGSTPATIIHTPALQTAGGRETARSGAQVAVLLPNVTNGIAIPGGPQPAGFARVIAAIRGRQLQATGTATGACSNAMKQSRSGSTTTTDWFYDAPCTTLETEMVITQAPDGLSGSGTSNSFDRNGSLRVAEKVNYSVFVVAATASAPARETLTLEITASATANGTTTGQFGVTCTGPINSPTSPTVTCSGAHNGVSGGVGFGDAFATSGSAASGSTGASASVNVSFFLGPNLGIAQSGTTWAVSGNGAFNSASGAITYTGSNNSGPSSLVLKDVLYTYAQTGTTNANGATSVTIVENPNGIVTSNTPIATAAVDAGGVGSITFADGTSEPIAGWLVGY